jgi:hypothetical protein
VLGERARQRALDLFVEDRMVREHLALYRELLGELVPSPMYVRG